MPAAWDRERLLDAALAWRMVPLDADVVIATNFPSYFARHPRKVLWLAHQHRGAYDGIDQPWSDLGGDEAGLEIQRQLTEWDTRAIGEASPRFTIGRVVSRAAGPLLRPRQHAAAPPAAAGRPAHDRPLRRLRLRREPAGGQQAARPRGRRAARGAERGAGRRGRHRFDAPGARGGDRRRRAAADGWSCPASSPTTTSCRCWPGASAVIYAPYDEDYGYVTLQAFLAGKPVITTTDSRWRPRLGRARRHRVSSPSRRPRRSARPSTGWPATRRWPPGSGAAGRARAAAARLADGGRRRCCREDA